jgi:phage N-6-adenine-methyltransferase
MPPQKKGTSKQDYGTPREFIAAVEARFGALHVDLAARADNAKAPRFITPERDSLTVPWARSFPKHRAWLNPEFADIAPWAEKSAAETAMGFGLKVFLLTPASVGAVWFDEHVHRKALVLGLRPRLRFEGATDDYPKDCMLSVFGYGVTGFDVWRWK